MSPIDVSNNPELLKKLVSLVEDGDDFDCPICLSAPVKTVITCCTHIFCQNCILKILKNPNSRCPICRQSLSKADLFLAPDPTPDELELNPSAHKEAFSSKVATLLKFLQESKKQDPLTKSVVFSQFRKMLLLLEAPLKAAGFGVLRLDGSMSAKKRSEVIKEFSQCGPKSPTVLLASLKAAGAGINLTAASRVYLMEPWWNPGAEEQAMDRVHRIGQQQEVKVVRLIIKDSIEERILELQEKKMKLASGAFRRKGAEEQKRMRIEDLRVMMRL
jgi:SWI/SNF-related matrix-associated actin-dependent regulator of chromatin subfamily A3